MLRRLLFGVGLAVAAAILATLLIAFWPTHTRVIASGIHPDAALIEQGRYLALASDCAACHTTPGSAPFTGGVAIQSPLGAIYSTNITPDPDAGIGRYSLNDFDRAVRHGIDRQNNTLYPAMPYPSYARITDADLVALYAYFMHGVTPVRVANRPNAIPWPLSMRWPLAIWRKSFGPSLSAPGFAASHYPDPVVARGAYLVQGPGHCGSCHTPRAVTLQEEALDEAGDAYLAGGPIIDGWVAVALRGDPADGLGSWTVDDIVSTLRSARNPNHAVIGAPMSEAVVHGTQYLTDADLHAMAAYLKTLPAGTSAVSTYTADSATASALAVGHEANRGAQLYVDNCAACHRTNGAGAAGVFPAIAGNSSVLAADSASIVRLILRGSSLPATNAAPSTLGMPGFGWRLSDQEVAELTTFVRESWGNHAPGVSAAQVRKIRDSLASVASDSARH